MVPFGGGVVSPFVWPYDKAAFGGLMYVKDGKLWFLSKDGREVCVWSEPGALELLVEAVRSNAALGLLRVAVLLVELSGRIVG